MCVLCVPPLHTVWFHRCAEEETEAICVTPWETFFFFFSFIYLFINYALYETTHFTVICMKWCEWKQENLYLQYCPYKASLTHTLMLNKLNDYNGVLHRTGTFYTHNFIHPFERTQYRACFFLTSCGMDPCCKCTWFRPCMVLCCIGSS